MCVWDGMMLAVVPIIIPACVGTYQWMRPLQSSIHRPPKNKTHTTHAPFTVPNNSDDAAAAAARAAKPPLPPSPSSSSSSSAAEAAAAVGSVVVVGRGAVASEGWRTRELLFFV